MNATIRKRLSAPQRRKQLLAAALHKFAELGYHGTSMDDVAATAGVTKPLLYDHFTSKQDLFVAVLESIRDELLALGARAAVRPVSPEGQFRAAISAFFAYVKAHPQGVKVLFLTAHHDPVATALSNSVQAGASKGIAALLRLYWHPATPRDLAAGTEFLKGGLHALAHLLIESPRTSEENIVEVVMQLAWLGLAGARPMSRG